MEGSTKKEKQDYWAALRVQLNKFKYENVVFVEYSS